MHVNLSFPALQTAYAEGSSTPTGILETLYPLLEQEPACFVSLTSYDALLDRCRLLEAQPKSRRRSLWGIPFAVKDNIDVAGFPTTAACPSFSYTPDTSAPAVQILLDEGGVMVGKTNMDQFAAGLVGTRTPYGTARNAFDDRFVPGGSSSGSGALVGSGLVSFALGTDTAGSGRVPAMLNGCVGIKPTVRRVSTKGVVPACRSLDCISCFARTVEDGAKVIKLMQLAGKLDDPNWRPPPAGVSPQGVLLPRTLLQRPLENGHHSPQDATDPFCNPRFCFGVPSARFLEFEGPGGKSTAKAYDAAFSEAVERTKSLNGEVVEVNFAPFCEIAALLYNSAFVAERYAGIRAFVDAKAGKGVSKEAIEGDERMEAVTAAIIARGTLYSAADVYEAFADMAKLSAQARAEMAKVDMLLVPTVLQHFMVAEVEAEEKRGERPAWTKNSLCGRFTNFVNLLDMAAISVPSALLQSDDLAEEASRSETNGDESEISRRAHLLAESGNPRPYLPFGVTLIGPAWTDEFLWEIAAKLHAKSGLECGPKGHGVRPYRSPTS